MLWLKILMVVYSGYGLFCTQVMRQLAGYEIAAFIGGYGYEQVGFTDSGLFQAT